MKKLFGILSATFAFIGLFILASCSSKSGIKVEVDCSATTTSVTVNLTFAANEHITDGSAALYVKCYDYSGDEASPVGTYKQKQGILWENNVYTSSSVNFESLTKGTKYAFRLYCTYKKKDEVLKEWTYETKSGTVDVSTVAEFKAMTKDSDGDYRLTADIDFNGETIAEMFTSTSTAFTGSLDGQGHTISNFKFSSSTFGLFSYTSGATIKNLKVVGTTEAYKNANTNEDGEAENIINGDFSGRTSANIGILVGTAEDTLFENVEVSNAIIKISTSSNATINVGGVVGLAKNTSFNNVDASDVLIDFIEAKKEIMAGLLVGQFVGDSFFKDEDGQSFAIKDSSATGKLSLVLASPLSAGLVYVGGVVGGIRSTAVVSNTYSVCDITISKKDSAVGNYNLCVGGFVGTNLEGSMYIVGCATVADINVYSGSASTEDPTTLNDNKLTDYKAYVGGFVGAVYQYINTIKNSAYFKKANGVNVYAKLEGTDSEGNSEVYGAVSNVVARCYDNAVLNNVVCYNDEATFDTTVLGADVQVAVADYK